MLLARHVPYYYLRSFQKIDSHGSYNEMLLTTNKRWNSFIILPPAAREDALPVSSPSPMRRRHCRRSVAAIAIVAIAIVAVIAVIVFVVSSGDANVVVRRNRRRCRRRCRQRCRPSQSSPSLSLSLSSIGLSPSTSLSS